MIPSTEYLTSELGEAAQARAIPCVRFFLTRCARVFSGAEGSDTSYKVDINTASGNRHPVGGKRPPMWRTVEPALPTAAAHQAVGRNDDGRARSGRLASHHARALI